MTTTKAELLELGAALSYGGVTGGTEDDSGGSSTEATAGAGAAALDDGAWAGDAALGTRIPQLVQKRAASSRGLPHPAQYFMGETSAQ